MRGGALEALLLGPRRVLIGDLFNAPPAGLPLTFLWSIESTVVAAFVGSRRLRVCEVSVAMMSFGFLYERMISLVCLWMNDWRLFDRCLCSDMAYCFSSWGNISF